MNGSTSPGSTASPSSTAVAPVSPLAELTTMGVGGRPREMYRAGTEQEIVEAVADIDSRGVPLLVLGGGSNLVVADEGFEGAVLQVASEGVQVESDDACGGVVVVAAAGEPWDDLVARAVAESWSGIEALSGIPGSTGATPVQNVGAYGQEVSQTIWNVRVYDRAEQRVRTLANADCGFSYRHSVFKASLSRSADPSPRYVVLSVSFQLRPTDQSAPIRYADLARGLEVSPGDRVPLAQARDGVLTQRTRRGMVLDRSDHDTWSCGSFFTNPVLDPGQVAELRERSAASLGPQGPRPPEFSGGQDLTKTSAAWLIEQAGFGRGFGLPGPASLSTKHTLAITNRGSARASDITALARQVRDGVADRFGVTLVNEPVLVGVSL
ncbi:MAG: UDP-N-acetylmuramate dehydrogenase [Ornithinimicrobium sp.]